MIVDSMSYAEIAREIRKDVHNVLVAASRIGYDKKYRKVRLGSNNRGMLHFKEVEFISSNKNRVVVFPHSPSRKHYLENSFVLATPIWFCRYKGQFLAALSCNTMTESVADIQFFTEHFFLRYNERYLKNPVLNVEEVARVFFKNEDGQTCIRSVFDPKTKREEKICIFTNGNSFIEIGEDFDYFIHRTFVNSDMLFASQNRDLFLLESVKTLVKLHSHGLSDYLSTYAHYKKLLEPEFRLYSFLHSQAKVNHQMHIHFQEVAFRLYNLLKEVWTATENQALIRFGKHLLEIAHASGPIEIEALLKAEGNKHMQ